MSPGRASVTATDTAALAGVRLQRLHQGAGLLAQRQGPAVEAQPAALPRPSDSTVFPSAVRCRRRCPAGPRPPPRCRRSAGARPRGPRSRPCRGPARLPGGPGPPPWPSAARSGSGACRVAASPAGEHQLGAPVRRDVVVPVPPVLRLGDLLQPELEGLGAHHGALREEPVLGHGQPEVLVAAGGRGALAVDQADRLGVLHVLAAGERRGHLVHRQPRRELRELHAHIVEDRARSQAMALGTGGGKRAPPAERGGGRRWPGNHPPSLCQIPLSPHPSSPPSLRFCQAPPQRAGAKKVPI